jgi:hypothetical protein
VPGPTTAGSRDFAGLVRGLPPIRDVDVVLVACGVAASSPSLVNASSFRH